MIKIGTGIDILGGINVFTGGLTIKQGTLAAASVTALGGSAGNNGTVFLGDTTGAATRP